MSSGYVSLCEEPHSFGSLGFLAVCGVWPAYLVDQARHMALGDYDFVLSRAILECKKYSFISAVIHVD